MDLGKSKVTIIKYDNKDNLDRFLSNLNYINLESLDMYMNLSSLKRDLVIEEILLDKSSLKYFYVNIDTVETSYNHDVPGQRGSNRIIVINNLIANLHLDNNFRLIFGFTNESFNYDLINRCNLFLEISGDKIEKEISSYNID